MERAAVFHKVLPVFAREVVCPDFFENHIFSYSQFAFHMTRSH